MSEQHQKNLDEVASAPNIDFLYTAAPTIFFLAGVSLMVGLLVTALIAFQSGNRTRP